MRLFTEEEKKELRDAAKPVPKEKKKKKEKVASPIKIAPQPLCKVRSHYPLIYTGPTSFILLHEVEAIWKKHGIRPRRQRNKPHLLIWTGYSNSLEVCFDLEDVAKKTKFSLSYVKQIVCGLLPPPTHPVVILPFPQAKCLVGYKREDLPRYLFPED